MSSTFPVTALDTFTTHVDTETHADGAVSSGSTAFTSSLGAFVAADTGKTIAITGAGAAGATLTTTVTYVSATALTLAVAASTTVSGATYTLSETILAAHMNNVQDAVAALEAKVGLNGSAVTSSLDYLITNGISTHENVGGGTLPANTQSYIKSALAATVPLIIDTPASPSVDLLKLRVNGSDLIRATFAGTLIAPTFYGALVTGGSAPANTSNYILGAATGSAPLVIDAPSGQTASLLDVRNNGATQAFLSPAGQLGLGNGVTFYNSEQLKIAQLSMPNGSQSVMVLVGYDAAAHGDVRFGQTNSIYITHTTGTTGDTRAADYSVYYEGTSATNPAVNSMTGFNAYSGVGGVSPSGIIGTANVVNIGSLYSSASGTPSVTVNLQNGIAIGDMKSGATGVTVTNANALRIFGQTSPAYAIYAEGRCYLKSNAVGDATLTLDTLASQTADILDLNMNGATVAKVDKSGNVIAAGFADKTSSTAPAVVTGGTITIAAGTSAYRITSAAAITGVILSAGLFDGQEISIGQESAFTVTFAALATSRVSNGVACVIAASASRSFRWFAAANGGSGWWSPQV